MKELFWKVGRYLWRYWFVARTNTAPVGGTYISLCKHTTLQTIVYVINPLFHFLWKCLEKSVKDSKICSSILSLLPGRSSWNWPSQGIMQQFRRATSFWGEWVEKDGEEKDHQGSIIPSLLSLSTWGMRLLLLPHTLSLEAGSSRSLFPLVFGSLIRKKNYCSNLANMWLSWRL